MAEAPVRIPRTGPRTACQACSSAAQPAARAGGVGVALTAVTLGWGTTVYAIATNHDSVAMTVAGSAVGGLAVAFLRAARSEKDAA